MVYNYPQCECGKGHLIPTTEVYKTETGKGKIYHRGKKTPTLPVGRWEMNCQ